MFSTADTVPGGRALRATATSALVDARTPRVLAPRLLAHVADVHVGTTPKRERVLADDLGREVFLDVAAHALDDRHDGDQEHHADHDTKQGEEALQLLHPDLRQREPNGLEELHSESHARRERGTPVVARDDTVAQHDDAPRVRRDVRLVRDHDDRLTLRREPLEDAS